MCNTLTQENSKLDAFHLTFILGTTEVNMLSNIIYNTEVLKAHLRKGHIHFSPHSNNRRVDPTNLIYIKNKSFKYELLKR